MYRALQPCRSVGRIVQLRHLDGSIYRLTKTSNSLYSSESKVYKSNATKPLDDGRLKKIDSSDGRPAFLDELRSLVRSIETNNDAIEIDNLGETISKCANVSQLLRAIEHHLDDLTSDQLGLIYDKITELIKKFRKKLRENDKRPIKQFYNTIESSTIFDALLDRTAKLASADKLSTESSIRAFRAFQMSKLNLKNAAFEAVLKNCIKRLQCMSLSQLYAFLLPLDAVSKIEEGNKGFYFRLNQKIMKIAEIKIKTLKPEDKDNDTIIKFHEIFLSHDEVPMINSLNDQLLAPEIQLNFVQSIELLRNIQKARNIKLRNEPHSTLFEGCDLDKLDQLIDKCNRSVLEGLRSDPRRNSFFYLNRMHDFLDHPKFDLKKLHDPQILDCVAQIVSEYSKEDLSYMIFYVYDLINNYSKSHIFNEKILQVLYDATFAINRFRQAYSLNAFNTFSMFKLPFVDYPKLVQLILDDDESLREQFKGVNVESNIFFISNLILMDFNDTRLLEYIDILLDRLRESRRGQIEFKFRHLSLLNLVRFHLTRPIQMEDSLKSQIVQKFDNALFPLIGITKELARLSTLSLGPKLRNGAVLSGGFYLDGIAIYDRSKQDLIPLDDYKDYFNEVEKMPLDKNQQVLSFLKDSKLGGHTGPKRQTDYHRLQIFEFYNIKPIYIPIENYELPLEKLAEVLVKQALDQCRNDEEANV